MSFEGIDQTGAVDYMLRTTQQHHVQLSLMADQKASIMIASSSIVLTFAFANFKQQNLFWGFLALFLFAFISLVLAVLAVIPRFGSNSPGRARNLLFFGDFADMSLADYQAAVGETIRTDEKIYEAVTADIHSLGCALRNRKYRYLGYSYRTFLVGLLTAGSLFLLQTVLFYFT